MENLEKELEGFKSIGREIGEKNNRLAGLESEIQYLDSKIVQKILKEVLKYHPLVDYIEDWMGTFQSLEEMKK